MSSITFLGSAPSVAKQKTATPANVGVGDIFTLTINGKSVSFTAAAATVANVTAGLTTAWNTSTIAEFMEVTATDMTTHVLLTADTAGNDFEVTSSTTDGNASNTQTLTMATTVANSSPTDISVAANYSGGALPANGDTLYFDGSVSNVSANQGLSALNAVTLAGLYVLNGYSGDIGRVGYNASGYNEYRTRELTVGATLLQVDTDKIRLFRINNGSVQTAATFNQSGETKEQGLQALQWRGTHASNVVNVTGDAVSLGIGQIGGSIATVAVLNHYNGNVVCGLGATITSHIKPSSVLGTYSRR